jgi:UDP-N-acetylmuramoyl-tripeptide--D-alanyl-D-alanine ligase
MGVKMNRPIQKPQSFELQEVLNATHGVALQTAKSHFHSVQTDTRKDLSGALFIALKGDRFDAHDFVHQAAAAGAAGVVIHKDLGRILESLPKSLTVIKVDDTLKALQQLGQAARRRSRARFIGITGSNGKTSTKEFAAQIVGTKHRVHYSKGSFNNHWGVPMTLLDMPDDIDFAFIEMGMNHAGEITELIHIAEPDIVVCTMVGRAHIEFFGTQEKIAEAKKEIYQETTKTPIRIFNLDNEFTRKMLVAYQNQGPVVTFSESDPRADICLTIKTSKIDRMIVNGRIKNVEAEAEVYVFGLHNITNLMAAAAIALACGLTPDEIWKGLPACQGAWGRNQLSHLELKHTSTGLTHKTLALFDAYNANPDSMGALLDNLDGLQDCDRKVLVLGQMRELGDHSPQAHFDLGLRCAKSNYKKVFFAGDQAEDFAKGFKSFNSEANPSVVKTVSPEWIQEIRLAAQDCDLIAFKASRGMELEKVLEQLSGTKTSKS